MGMLLAKAVELGGPEALVGLAPAGRLELAAVEHALPERRLVDGAPADRLMGVLEIAQGELCRQHLYFNRDIFMYKVCFFSSSSLRLHFQSQPGNLLWHMQTQISLHLIW